MQMQTQRRTRLRSRELCPKQMGLQHSLKSWWEMELLCKDKGRKFQAVGAEKKKLRLQSG